MIDTNSRFAHIPERISGLGELAYNLWWIEGFNGGKNGWAFEGKSDAEDAESVYGILEKEMVPLYYRVDDDGVPHDWVKVMKEAIAGAAPAFSARRMLKEYALKFYRNALRQKEGQDKYAGR